MTAPSSDRSSAGVGPDDKVVVHGIQRNRFPARRKRSSKPGLIVLSLILLAIAGVLVYQQLTPKNDRQALTISQIPPGQTCTVRCDACGRVFEMNERAYTRAIIEAHQKGKRVRCRFCGEPRAFREGGPSISLVPPDGTRPPATTQPLDDVPAPRPSTALEPAGG